MIKMATPAEKKHIPVECSGFTKMEWLFDGTVERRAALRSRAASGRWGKFSLRYAGAFVDG